MDRDQLKRLQGRYARRAQPIGLTAEELDFANMPSKTDVHGIPVQAWIRFQDCAELVDGLAHSWTPKAVQVHLGVWRWPRILDAPDGPGQ